MKIKCKICNTIIEGDKLGNLIWCKCGQVAIDETKYYAIIFGESENIEKLE